MICEETGIVYAGKIVAKELLVKPHQKEKVCILINDSNNNVMIQMTQEIEIHRSLSHKHVVGFHGFFDDSNNVYILLELCKRRVRDIII